MIGAITAGIGLASSIYGNIKSAQANREAAGNLADYQNDQNSFLNEITHRDYLQTNAAKGVVEQLRSRYKKQAKTIDSNTAATGATDEANVAAKTAANEQYNQGLNYIAQKGTDYQRTGEFMKFQSMSDLYKQRMALNAQKNKSATNLTGAGAELLGSAADVAAAEIEDGKYKFGKDT